VVLFGTLYPLFVEAVADDKISVGPPFFNASFIPIMLPLIVVMAVGPLLSWKRADLPGVLSRLKWVAALTAIAALVAWYIDTGGPVLAVIAIAVAVWLFFATLREWALRVKLGSAPLAESWRRARGLPRASHGMTLAHAGLAVCILGFTGSSAWKDEVIRFGAPGTEVSIAGFDLRLEKVERLRGPNYFSDMGTFTVTRDGEPVAVMRPERRSYPVAQSQTTEAAIRSTIAGDLYVSITAPADEEAQAAGMWTMRILYEPLVGFIWLGTFMLVGGGLLSLSDRRLRVGAPRRSRVPSAVATPAE